MVYGFISIILIIGEKATRLKVQCKCVSLLVHVKYHKTILMHVLFVHEDAKKLDAFAVSLQRCERNDKIETFAILYALPLSF